MNRGLVASTILMLMAGNAAAQVLEYDQAAATRWERANGEAVTSQCLIEMATFAGVDSIPRADLQREEVREAFRLVAASVYTLGRQAEDVFDRAASEQASLGDSFNRREVSASYYYQKLNDLSQQRQDAVEALYSAIIVAPSCNFTFEIEKFKSFQRARELAQ